MGLAANGCDSVRGRAGIGIESFPGSGSTGVPGVENVRVRTSGLVGADSPLDLVFFDGERGNDKFTSERLRWTFSVVGEDRELPGWGLAGREPTDLLKL